MNHETPAPPSPTGRSLRVPILVAAILVGAGAVVLARKYERPAPKPEPPAPGMTVGKDSVTLTDKAPAWDVIKVGAPSPAEPHWTDAIPARIVFDETHASRMGSPLAGRVTAVSVERGQRVKAGAALFTVASPSLAELHTESAKANVERATAKANLDRVQALVDAGSLPAKELVTAKQEVAEQDLAVKLASQKLASLRVGGGGESSFTVTAPRDGVVVEKNLAVGQLVDPSQGSLVAIADLSQVWVVADLFESDVGALAPGAKAKVLIGDSTQLDAEVAQVSSVVDPDRHTVPVRLALPNPDGLLRPNAYAQIKFFDATPAKVSLPSSAVLSDGAQSYVYVKEKSGAMKRHDITVGSVSAGHVPVLAGLEPTDQVVLKGAILLDNQIELDN